MFNYRHLFFMPSFYLLSTFTCTYLLYLSGIIGWEQPPEELHFWCVSTILIAAISFLIFHKNINKEINAAEKKQEVNQPYLSGKIQWILLFSMLLLGALGIVKYVLDYSKFVGAFGILVSIFTEDTGQLRTMADNVESWGTQLSYFTWIAAFIIAMDMGSKKLSYRWGFLLFLIVLLNSIFLDRTRPVWIIFTCVLCFFMTRYHSFSRKNIVYILSAVILFFISLFVAIGSLLGKGADDENYLTVDLPKWTQSIFLYLTSSFAYLGRLIHMDMSVDYYPARITYPLQKFLAKAQWVDQPPSQILDFYHLPLITNVGTFLEPFFQDGGRVFLFLAIIIHTLLFDYWTLYLLKKRYSVFSIITISTLCFTNFIGFFVPKITSTATWFVILVAFLLWKAEWVLGFFRAKNQATS